MKFGYDGRMLGILLYLLIVIAAGIAAYYLGLLNGALYIPTDAKLVDAMLDASALTPADTLVDIGSGDGRLVIAAARRGAHAVGYEINPFLVWLSRRKAKEGGVSELARFEWRDFWRADLSPYSVVTVFGIGHIMGRLERKLATELKPGSRVACNLFAFPNWEGEKKDGVFVYKR